MKIYTIVAGVNGVGKSSLTGALKAEKKDLGIIIDVDKLTESYGGDRIAGGRDAITTINKLIEQGICLTQETTLSGVRTLKTIKTAREQGYFIRLYYVGLNTAQESLSRIENRVSKGGHNIPTSDVTRRFAARFDDLLAVLPFCDEATLFDNDNGFVEVAEYSNGELLPKGSYTPQWLTELLKHKSDN